jgi:antitoxin Phd
MRESNIWKLQDAKARFSEVVRRARAGEPQQITVHGREAVVVVDPERFEIRTKPPAEPTLAGFIERSKKYRGAHFNIRSFKMKFPSKYVSPFDEDER